MSQSSEMCDIPSSSRKYDYLKKELIVEQGDSNSSDDDDELDAQEEDKKKCNGVYYYYNVADLDPEKITRLPYSIRVLLESAVRNCDEFQVCSKDVEAILNWHELHQQDDAPQVFFMPSRVLLQDFTGIPAVVDFAAMRNIVKRLGGNPENVNPACPTDLIVDHSIQVDVGKKLIVPSPPPPPLPSPYANNDIPPPPHAYMTPLPSAPLPFPQHPCIMPPMQHMCSSPLLPAKSPAPATNQIYIESAYRECPFHNQKTEYADIIAKNYDLEFERNRERFELLKWSSKAFKNVQIVPSDPLSVHQINLEYLARVVFNNEDNVLFPDSLVGTDSHTTMINGMGVLGWSLGGIESEAVMLGQSASMPMPQVIGYKLKGQRNETCTSTDIVLAITKHLRQIGGVVNKFVEFFGPGVAQLSIADRACIANMCPEYGALVGYFAADENTLEYLRQTGRSKKEINYIEAYLKAVKLFRDYENPGQDPLYSEVIELDLATIVTTASGPKRTQDKIPVTELKSEFKKSLTNPASTNGFGILPEDVENSKKVRVNYKNKEYLLDHGSVIIASISSCTNTTNPSVMLAAGLLAKKAYEYGLELKPYVKTSLSPGSGLVTDYLIRGGVLPYFELLGFNVVGYGCKSCINNSNSLDESIVEAIEKNGIIAAGMFSGNKNFEGRVQSAIKANYLVSPLLVIAYAITGSVLTDFDKEPLGYSSKKKKKIFLKDIWPSNEEVQIEINHMLRKIFAKVDDTFVNGNVQWNSLCVSDSATYPWNFRSSYIKFPQYLEHMTREMQPIESIANAHVLLYLGDSITTDHISPAGSISRNSPAAKYLSDRGMVPRDFNSYGSRRGHDEVMSRGTFYNLRLTNKLVAQQQQLNGPKTIHFPSKQLVEIFDAAQRYKNEKIPAIVIAGKDYGSGAPRDWAAKGPRTLGIRAILAESFDISHRKSLVSIGIMPLQFLDGQSAQSLQITGSERFTVVLDESLKTNQIVNINTDTGLNFQAMARIETNAELTYFKHGGLLNYSIRKFL